MFVKKLLLFMADFGDSGLAIVFTQEEPSDLKKRMWQEAIGACFIFGLKLADMIKNLSIHVTSFEEFYYLFRFLM